MKKTGKKSILIIGMGRFGQHLAINLMEKGNDVMVIDCEEKELEPLLHTQASIKIGDCTNPDVLHSLDVASFDMVVVCIGTNFQSSLEITSMAKEMGAKYVVSKATREIQAKFLLRNGADEVVYPEKDLAEKCAVRYSTDNIFNYEELTQDYGIYEIPPLGEWVGKSIRENNIAAKFKISILGIRKENGATDIMPNPDYVIQKEEHLMVLAQDKTLNDILKKL